MIRDPSDGSVRDMPKSGPAFQASQNTAERLPSSDAAEAGPDTGIRQPTKTDAQERLERSRQWLKDYHASKHGGKADDMVRRDNESELPSESGERTS